MMAAWQRQSKIEAMLREEFAKEYCRVVDRDGVFMALFLDEGGNTVFPPINLTKLAADIERRLS
jgi:hypothetical protein